MEIKKQTSTSAVDEQENASPAVPWQHLLSELIGTAILIGVGLSVVVLDFGTGSFVVHLLPSVGARRALTGFLFGGVGATIAVSQVGKVSGAHINPAVSLAFFLERKISFQLFVGYVVAQLAGAVIGAAPLLAWGSMGRSIAFGATVPGHLGPAVAILGEVVTTFCLVFGIFTMLGSHKYRSYTPLLIPPMYAVMVYLEASISDTSTNPARSLGPAVISGNWMDFYVYIVGPVLGTLGAVGLRRLPTFRPFEVEVAKVYRFARDPYHVLGSSRRWRIGATKDPSKCSHVLEIASRVPPDNGS